MTRTKLIGVRDPLGVRPLVLGRIGDDGWALSSETCGLDIIGADFVREIEPGEMVVIENGKVESPAPSSPRKVALLHLRARLFLAPRQHPRRPVGL
jgi:amidophosphoribosyltransferase